MRRHPQLLNIEPFSQICYAKFLTVSPELGSHTEIQVIYMVVILFPKLDHFLNHIGEQLPVRGGGVCGQGPLLMAAVRRDEGRNLPSLVLLKAGQPRASIYKQLNLNVCIIEISKHIYCPYIFGAILALPYPPVLFMLI